MEDFVPTKNTQGKKDLGVFVIGCATGSIV